MTSVDTSIASSPSTAELDAPQEAEVTTNDTALQATEVPVAEAPPIPEASDIASGKLKSALEETQQAAAKVATAAGKGGSEGVSRVLEAVVNLVSSLVGLIGSLFSQKEASGSSSSSGTTPSNSGSSDPSSGSAAPSGSSGSASGTLDSQRPTPSSSAGPGLQALTDERGIVTLRTPDGFMLKAEGKAQAWQIIGPEGRSTRIWGDPHVNESDGNKWNFKEQSTFVFGANKVTVEVSPTGKGETVSRRITLYNGTERVTIGGIDTNSPFIVGLANDGKQHDDSLNDGATYRRGIGKTGESWSKRVGGRNDVM